MSDLTQAPSMASEVRFTIGRSFSLSFGVLGRNFWPMALLALMVTGVQSAVDYLVTGDASGGENGANSFLNLLTYAFITAPVTYATFQDLRGTRVPMKDLLGRGFGRVGRVLAVAFGLGLVLALPIFVVVAAGAAIGVPIFALLGVAAIYALYILVLWFVVIPVQVVERTGFSAGFTRASQLSAGQRWRLLGLMLVYVILIVALAVIMFLLIYIGPDSQAFVALVVIPFYAFYSVMGAILPAVVYYLLRAQKEGVGIDEIAKVFD
jgi:hypothetical protein